jgi:hypothetical protein
MAALMLVSLTLMGWSVMGSQKRGGLYLYTYGWLVFGLYFVMKFKKILKHCDCIRHYTRDIIPLPLSYKKN